jgi:hypothetical protein
MFSQGDESERIELIKEEPTPYFGGQNITSPAKDTPKKSITNDEALFMDMTEDVKSEVIEEFAMPMSLQHYDYSELLELLAHYRKSMKHYSLTGTKFT